MKASDILWYNRTTGETQVWYMDGHQLVDRGTVLGLDGNPALIGPPFTIVGVGDMNADGKADIVWYNSGTGETQIWYMDGHQLVDRGTVLGLDGNPALIGPPFAIVGVGDMNADRKADIVWYNSGTGETQVWYMDGHQLADRGTVLGLDGNPAFIGPPFSIVGIDDMNGDGRGDIVWYNSATGETQIWYMNGHRLVDRGTVLGLDGSPAFIGPPFSIAGVGDMNGDGRGDIVWYNGSTGETQVWYMDRHRLVERGTVLGLDGIAIFIGPPFSIVGIGKFIATRPPGRLLSKAISLDLLQRKFDEIFEVRDRPLFKIRLHNIGSGDHRHSTLTVYKLYVGDQYEELDPPKDLGQLSSSVADYYLNDFNTSNILSPDVIREEPPGLKILIYFEIKGEELKINNLPNVDFTSFKLELTFRFQLDSDNNLLVTERDLIKADVSTNAAPGYRHVVEDDIESGFKDKIYETLYGNGDGGEPRIQALNRTLKRFLLNGDFYVTSVSSDDQVLSIEYVVPPGQLEPFPEHPQAPLKRGRLSNIDHIVVLMMENRSFDHMLGYLSRDGGRADVDGLRGGEANRYNGSDYSSFLLPDTQFNESPCHQHECAENQIDGGKMDGFVASFAEHYAAVDPGRIMGFHNADHVPVYEALAREFLICQRWFAAHPGPTFCNRFYTLTGRLNRDSFGQPENNNPAGEAFKPVGTKTIFDHLSDHGVSWRYYEHRYCFLRLFERYTFDDNNYIVNADNPVNGFFASANAGTLPSVSFIDPNFIDEPDGQDNDDGAPADIRAGQNLIGRVVKAVMEGPNWGKSLLFITYDEHGGFFDHVNPLLFREKAIPVSGNDYYGVRVPAFVVSPWVDRGVVSDVVFDHTSIAKTIARRFMSASPPDMGERMAAASDLSMILRSTARKDRPSIPVPPAPVRTIARFITEVDPVTEPDDFKEMLRLLRSRYSIRK